MKISDLIGTGSRWAAACVLLGMAGVSAQQLPTLAPGVDYSKPNYAYSPPLRKFVDGLPGLTPAGANNLGQYIPVAVPDTTSYPGSDYYEIALVEYREQLHSDLAPVVGAKDDPTATGGVRLRGYVQQHAGTNLFEPHYLGPWIVAESGRPVRVKFTNKLPTGSKGDLFLPVDTTIMGAGLGPDGQHTFTQNRGSVHLHGGLPPWISDGTPNQWITPAGESTPYTKGATAQNVPDMEVPPDGSMTFYWPNGHSGRMLWFHDHTYGMTRLNVYAGEAAGYLVTDPTERALTAGMPEIPLVLQEKTFVPDLATLANQDPSWDTAKWGQPGELWFPHVYMPNQNPNSDTGALDWGRWDYGPWFWPPWNVIPGSTPPTVSAVPESFHDTPIVNGTAYPYLEVDPTEVRLRILNAANERFWNLQWYVADPAVYADSKGNSFTNTEVRMLPANSGTNWPSYFPTMAGDDRPGGVPDPALAGPAWLQIGNEGGLLPQPAVIQNVPVGYEYFRRTIVVLNVKEHALLLGPAERADVVVDFSPYAGQTLILFNDSPAPIPGFDLRNDHYTGCPSQEDTGGSPGTEAGWGPNTRTILQVRVRGNKLGNPSPAPMTPGDLPVNWINPATLSRMQTNLPAAFAATQDQPVVPQPQYDPVGYAYNGVAGAGAPLKVAHINDTSVTYIPYGSTNQVTVPFVYKAIHEVFDPIGRMNAVLGTELPFTSAYIQTTLPLAYVDPATEVIAPGETQFWWITHNGVDTHAIHFHLVNVQVINRVGWDGAVSQPPLDDNEYGWKDTVRMNPLENILVAVRAKTPQVPFGVPESIHALDTTQPLGSTKNFSGIDPYTGNALVVTNQLVNVKWEFMWHCHLLGHEENDMMRPFSFTYDSIPPTAPADLVADNYNGVVRLTWTDPTPALDPATMGNPANEIGFLVYSAPVDVTGKVGSYSQIGVAPANRGTYLDLPASVGGAYSYIVASFNAAGTNVSGTAAYLPNPPSAPTGLTLALAAGPGINLGWTDTSTNSQAFIVERAVDPGFTTGFKSVLQMGTATTFADTPVAMNTQYYYRVRAVNAGGTSTPSAPATIGTYVPASPSGLAGTLVPATLATGPSVNLAWSNNATNAVSVLVERGTNAAFSGTVVSATLPASATSYQDTAPVIDNGRSNYYRVSAVNVLGKSPAAGGVTIAIPGVPSSPGGFNVTQVAGSGVLLAWTQAGVAPSGYLVQRALDAGFATGLASTSIGAPATSYTDTTVVTDTLYYYRVAAFTTGGYSPFSAVGSLTVLAAPGAPGALAASVQSATSIALSWTPGTGTVSTYVLQRSTNAAFATFTTLNPASTATSFVDTGVAAGNTYYYRLAASNAGGTSPYSNTAVQGVYAPAAPTTFAGVLVPATPTAVPTVNLTWANGATNATSVVVTRATNAAFTGTLVTATLAGNATAYTDPAPVIDANRVNYYRVAAANVVGTTAAANTVNITVPGIPSVPSALAAVQAAGPSVALTWTQTGTAPTGYVVTRAADAGFLTGVVSTTLNTGTTGYTDASVTAGSTYYYRVVAFTTGGYSAASAAASIAVVAAPGAPAGLAATILSASNVRLSWTAGTGVPTGYVLQRSTSATFATVTSYNLGASATSYTNTTAAAGNTYYYRLAATNAAGTSAYSATATAAVLVPTTPTGLAYVVSTGPSVVLSWVNGATVPQTGIVIQRATNAGFTQGLATYNVAANATTYTDATAAAGTTYFYRIAATNVVGTSLYSASVQVAVAFPAPPTAFTVTAVNGTPTDSATLTWTYGGTGQTGFTIQRATNAAFTAGLTSTTVGQNARALNVNGLTKATQYYFRIQANNAVGSSAWTNAGTFPVTTP